MSKPAFTPGPWAAFTDDSCARAHTNIVAVKPRTDCVFSLPGHHKDEPNVRLIAAAPDMYEALRGVVRILDAVRHTAGLSGNQLDRLERARIALAKAEGRAA